MKTHSNSSIKKILSHIAFGFSLLFSANSFANNCSMQQIDQYLKKGFSHEQVVKLCTENTNKTKPLAVNNDNLYNNLSNIKPQATTPNTTSQQVSNNEDQLYFATVLEATTVTFNNEKLSYESKECAIYGEIDMTQLRDKACIRSRVNIYLKGLQVVTAKKGIPLIQDQELIVKGHITREYLDTGKLNKYQMRAVQEQLPQQANKQDIPVKKGINPKDVVARLNRFIN